MTRLRFLSFFFLVLVAICFCFYQISKINIQQSVDETHLRLTQGQKALSHIEMTEARLSVASLYAAMRGSVALDSLDGVIAPGAGSGQPAPTWKLRQAIASALATTASEELTSQDLVFVQVGEAQHVIGADAASARVLKADAERLDLSPALDPKGHYAQFESRLYRLSAIEITRPAAGTAATTGDKAPRASDPQSASEEGVVRQTPVIVAMARLVDAATVQRLSSLIGVQVTIVAGEAVIAAPREEPPDEEERLDKLAALRASGPLPLKPFVSLSPLPLALPLFLSNPASHQAQVLPLPDVAEGHVILDTQMDGLLMLAFVQKRFLLGLLAFLVVGVLFALSLGNVERGSADQAPRVRKVPIAGQSLSKAPFTRAASAHAAHSSDDKKKASQELTMLDAPRAEESIPKTLAPEEFNFGNSPLAEELSPQPVSLVQSAGTTPGADAPVDEALVPEEDPFAAEAYQAAAEDFTATAADYQYPEQPMEAMPPNGAEHAELVFAHEGSAYPVQDASQIYDGKTPVPGLYGAAEGYQPAAPAGPESLESFYDDAACFEREATRQMSLEALNALNALQAGAAGPAPIWDPSSGNAAADYGYGNGSYGDPDQLAYEGQDPGEAHFREIYEQFVALRAQCGEPPTSLTYEGFALKLRKNREQLMQKYNCAAVRFQVYVKEGKAALKATPIRA